MNLLADRLKLALAKSGKRKTDLGKTCGITSGAITQWFDGTTKELTGKNLATAAKVLGVNPTWLATGVGEMSVNCAVESHIGDRIRRARKERGLTQNELAKQAKVLQSTIADLERGHTEKSTSLVEIADVLGVSALWLTTGKEDVCSAWPHKLPADLQAVFDDLLTLPPEDADVWKAQLRAAAIKVRQEKMKAR